jgi:hypothetical protein
MSNTILPTQLPYKFSCIVAIFIHNHFESPDMYSRLQKKNRVHHKNHEHSIFLFLTHVNQAFSTFNGILFQIGYV